MGTLVKTSREILSSRNRQRTAVFGVAAGLVLVLNGLAGCRGWKPLGEGKPALELSSSSFRQGEIQKECTCDGGESSPDLSWSAPPVGTRSFALIAVDRDSPLGYTFVHWVLYNVPPGKRDLPEGLPKQERLPDGSLQGLNDFGKIGYAGPCPPGSSAHRYVFALYALDASLNLPAKATRKKVENALKGHILARGELTGRYKR